MDGKGRRGLSRRNRQTRPFHIGDFARSCIQYLKTHAQAFITGLLAIALVVLLFGITSHFQSPTTDVASSNETTIGYSAFLTQVDDGNVMAVAVRGKDLHGLLIRSYSPTISATATPPVISASQRTADFTAFSHFLSGGSSWATVGQSPGIDPSRMVFSQVPSTGDAALMSLLLSKHVIVSVLPPAQPSIWLTVLWRILPFFLIIFVIGLFLSQRGSGRSTGKLNERFQQMSKSKARLYEREDTMKKKPESKRETSKQSRQASQTFSNSTNLAGVNKPGATPVRTRVEPTITFEDVAGIDEVREELEEIVQFLRSPERYERLGAKLPRGALLVGPPGTGKTLLARAVAGEAGVPFFSMSASEFVEMFVGVGASRVRDLFKQAKQAAPCVVFIDEIDAVGRKRNVKVMGNDERDQTLNQLLVELDGFTARQAIVVMAATNRVDILDKALLRPGRFDRHITVSLPDRAGREAILRVHTRKVPLEESVSLALLSRITTGMSGADLANLVNEAALCAARRDLEKVNSDCFEDALARIQLGALRPIVMSEAQRRIIAYHEGGHALVAYHLPDADTVNRVTILPRGQSLGVTQFTSEEDRYNYSRQVLMTRIAVGLGGRAAEELTFGTENVTTGAENDLQVVTGIARNMVTRWGMSEQLGVVFADYRAEAGGAGLNMRRVEVDAFSSPRTLVADADGRLRLNAGDRGDRGAQHAMQYAYDMQVSSTPRVSSVSMAATIDAEVQRILHEGYTMARAILQERHDQLEKLSAALLEHEQLDRKQFEALFQEVSEHADDCH